MAKSALQRSSPVKQPFGIPSLEVAARIDDSDATNAAVAANFRFTARIRELEAQFEQKASEIRAAYLKELDNIRGCEEE